VDLPEEEEDTEEEEEDVSFLPLAALAPSEIDC
jgi:hypothetical protein